MPETTQGAEMAAPAQGSTRRLAVILPIVLIVSLFFLWGYRE